MSANRISESASTASHTARQRHTKRSVSGAGMILGLFATILFYLIAPRLATFFAGGPQFVERYFCGHPLEYVTSALFFVGIGILVVKWKQLPTERSAINSALKLAASPEWSGDDASQQVERILSEWQNTPGAKTLSASSMWRRVDDVLHYINAGRNGGLEDHLKYLADLSVDRLIQSYSLIRTVTWAVPIMGFLGTVIGITMAIANVTPEQLDSSLPEVTAGLAVAFDTTAQALTMSMVLVFATFLVERGEQSVLNEVEQFGIDSLIPYLGESVTASRDARSGLPVFADWTTEMLAEQTASWHRHLNTMQSNWAEALTSQTDNLTQALSTETEATLNSHRMATENARDEYAATLHQSSQMFMQQMQQTIVTFIDRVDLWQSAMRESSMAAAGQAEELHRLGRTMLQLTESEQKLIQLQQSLNSNLQTLELVTTLEQTVQSLNVAVSLLTSKTSMRVAA